MLSVVIVHNYSFILPVYVDTLCQEKDLKYKRAQPLVLPVQ